MSFVVVFVVFVVRGKIDFIGVGVRKEGVFR